MLLLCTQVTLCLWHGGTRWCQEVWHSGGLIVGNPEGFLGGIPKLPAHRVSERAVRGLMPTGASALSKARTPPGPQGRPTVAPSSAPTAPAVSWQCLSCSAAAPEVVLQVKPHSRPSPPSRSRMG